MEPAKEFPKLYQGVKILMFVFKYSSANQVVNKKRRAKCSLNLPFIVTYKAHGIDRIIELMSSRTTTVLHSMSVNSPNPERKWKEEMEKNPMRYLLFLD